MIQGYQPKTYCADCTRLLDCIRSGKIKNKTKCGEFKMLPPNSGKKNKEVAKAIYRPCKVDGKRALFHRWIEEDSVIFKFDISIYSVALQEILQDIREKQYCPRGVTVEKVKNNFALVEYEDGTVAKVAPEKVVFLDDEVRTFFSQNYTIDKGKEC